MAQVQTEADRETGVPIGGVDTGYITVYPDGAWSGLCLPGDPARASSRIMPGAFAALRVQSGAKSWTRLLAGTSRVPASVSGTRPEGLPSASFRGMLRFPKAAFKLREPALPVEFEWTWHASVIPFDHDASCMPALFFRAELRNMSEDRVKCSVLLNMAPPPIVSREPFHTIIPALVEYEEHVRLKPEGGFALEGHDQGVVRNAMHFGGPPDGPGPALEACLAVRAWNARLTATAWNPLNAIEEARLWEDFGETGHLPRTATGSAASHGAVCCGFEMNPGEKRHVVFVYAWYCRASAAMAAPAYAALWGDVGDVTRHAMRHADYLFSAVGDWQARLLDGSAIVPWLGPHLVRSAASFPRSAALAPNGAFQWRSGPEGGAPCDRFDLCLPVMLFFPRYEAAALSEYAASDRPPATMEESAAFALSAYRDYLHTGSLTHLQEFWPAVLRDANAALLNTGSVASAGAAGRRVAALRACVHLAEAMRDPAGPIFFDACRRAWVEYETRFWDKKTGLYGGPGEDPAEAMSGLCQVAALRMDDVAQPARVAGCLRALAKDPRAELLPTASLARLAFLERHYGGETAAGGVWATRLAGRLEKDTAFDPRLLWPFFQAVGGMLHAVPAQRIYLDPRPGANGAETVVNLMTPLCFGRMRHRETPGSSGPEMWTDLVLDSPVIIRELVLRVPAGLASPLVRCIINDDAIPCDTAPRAESGRSEVLIRFRAPVQLADPLSVFVRESVVEKKRRGWLR